jgi:hypothetical protein
VLVLVASMHPVHLDDATSPADQETFARIHEQVRLRKLHLVRPDLIPYPISFEVYC